MPALRKLRYALQQRMKRMVEARTWGRGALLACVLAAEEEARHQRAPSPPQLA